MKMNKKHSDFVSWISYNEYILQSIKDDSRFERVVDMARRSRV